MYKRYNSAELIIRRKLVLLTQWVSASPFFFYSIVPYSTFSRQMWHSVGGSSRFLVGSITSFASVRTHRPLLYLPNSRHLIIPPPSPIPPPCPSIFNSYLCNGSHHSSQECVRSGRTGWWREEALKMASRRSPQGSWWQNGPLRCTRTSLHRQWEMHGWRAGLNGFKEPNYACLERPF